MSLTSYRTAPSRGILFALPPFGCLSAVFCVRCCLWAVSARYHRFREIVSGLTRFGGDLLSHVLRRSTIGAVALNCRVRDGIGCFAHAVTTKPRKPRPRGVWSARGEHRFPSRVHCRCMYAFDPQRLLCARPPFGAVALSHSSTGSNQA